MRSAFIERVLRKYFKDQRQAGTHARNLKLLYEAADRLKGKAEDLREYQTSTE